MIEVSDLLRDNSISRQYASTARWFSCLTFELNFPLVIRISLEETISRVRSGPSYYYGIVRLSFVLLTNASKLTIGLYAVSDGQGIMDELIINICRATFHDEPAKIKRCSVGLANYVFIVEIKGS